MNRPRNTVELVGLNIGVAMTTAVLVGSFWLVWYDRMGTIPTVDSFDLFGLWRVQPPWGIPRWLDILIGLWSAALFLAVTKAQKHVEEDMWFGLCFGVLIGGFLIFFLTTMGISDLGAIATLSCAVSAIVSFGSSWRTGLIASLTVSWCLVGGAGVLFGIAATVGIIGVLPWYLKARRSPPEEQSGRKPPRSHQH